MTMLDAAHPSAAAPHHRPKSPDHQPYVLIPDGLIEAHVRDPLAVGVYVAIARLTLIRKDAIPLSAAELAAWMGSDTEADRAAIMRRIVKLGQGGWLVVTRLKAHKHTLLPTWGPDRAGQPRPWDFDQPATGRPAHLRGRRVPLALLDITLGQLKPQQGRAPALISRYLTGPLIDLTDIGTYTIRLRTEIAPTARLFHLDLTTNVLPSARALLVQAASGTLTTLRDGESIGVGLTGWGYDQLDITQPEQGCRSGSRSVGRSVETRDRAADISYSDAEDPTLTSTNAYNTWDVGIMESTNMESPPNLIDQTGGGRSAPAFDSEQTGHEEQQIVRIISETPELLSPQIIASHQALNPERVIFPGEWWELLALQDRHGEQQLLMWQARAARADRTRSRQIGTTYYEACAARATFETYRPPRWERAREMVAELPVDTVPPPLPPMPPAPALDAACDTLLRAMGIREREPLAHVPLPLIQQWAAVIDHAGLAARFDDVRAFAHTQLRLHQAPPPRAELDRWAERARKRAAATPPPPLTDDQLAQVRARDAAIEARAAVIAPHDLSDDERVMMLADLERGMTDAEVVAQVHARRAAATASSPTPTEVCQQLLERLHEPMHRALWPLLEHITLQYDGEMLRVVCRQVADLGTVEREVATRIRITLRQYDWHMQVRVVAQAAPPLPVEASPAPPAWIAPERWTTLPGLMRTALLGSRWEGGELRCASPILTTLVRTRFAQQLAALLSAVPQGYCDRAGDLQQGSGIGDQGLGGMCSPRAFRD
jgi:hypothetical protein